MIKLGGVLLGFLFTWFAERRWAEQRALHRSLQYDVLVDFFLIAGAAITLVAVFFWFARKRSDAKNKKKEAN